LPFWRVEFARRKNAEMVTSHFNARPRPNATLDFLFPQ
jgi:hypothetical protein